jgi:hypothetical protein
LLIVSFDCGAADAFLDAAAQLIFKFSMSSLRL